jgi:TolB-like protein
MTDRNTDIPEDKRIAFRMGVNLGDVIADGEDIFGDGVNIAARLEALSEPGGICISGAVRDHIRDKLPYPLEDMGEQSVKNIARPVRVYAFRPEAVAEMPPPGVLVSGSRRRSTALTALVAAVAAALIITVIAWWFLPDMRSTSSVTAHGSATRNVEASAAVIKPFVAPRLSIMVLPLTNLTDDQEQQYFADGITDDLTTDLSRISDSFVIARNTASPTRGKSVDVKQISRELGVHYVLEGSVRRSGEKVRVNAQLVDAQTGAHLWAERFDRDLGNLFDLQNEITGRIARALQSQLVIAEANRSIDRPDAQDYIFQGRAALTKPISRETYAEAESLFERFTLDPRALGSADRIGEVLVSRALIK